MFGSGQCGVFGAFHGGVLLDRVSVLSSSHPYMRLRQRVSNGNISNDHSSAQKPQIRLLFVHQLHFDHPTALLTDLLQSTYNTVMTIGEGTRSQLSAALM